MTGSGSTSRRRSLGRELRRLREGAELRIEDAARPLRKSTTWLSRVELGDERAVLRPAELRELARVYGIDDADQVDELLEALKQTEQPDWWEKYKDVLPAGLDTLVGLESDARVKQEFEPLLVPGLLQTETYARAMYAIDRTRSPQAIDQLVAMRLERQHALTREPGPLRFVAILDEAVLRRTVGSTATMRDQLDHLIEAASVPNVSLQVVPFAYGAHNGMHGAFTLLYFDDEMTDSVAYVESQAGNLYQQKPRDVQRFVDMFAGLGHDAFDAAQTLALIARIAKEL